MTTWIPATLLERDSSTGVSVFCKFYEIFRRAFFQNTLWRPLLTWRCFFGFFCRSMRIAAKKNYFVERCYITKKNSGTGSILYSYGSQSGTSLARRWSVMRTFIIRFFKCKIFLKAGKKTAEMASGIRTILINTMFPLHRLGFTPLWNWYRIGFLLSL